MMLKKSIATGNLFTGCLPAFVFAGALLPWVAQAQEKLPANLKWETNDTDPTFASPDAKKGGTFRMHITEFPLTLRPVGPDANGLFANYLIYGGFLPLVERHANTRKTMPMLASEWAYGADKKTMYFRLNKNAKWSDGKPVTSDDVVFTVDFMRSKEIVDTSANDYYTTEIDKVIKYDDRTFALVDKNPKPDLDLYLGGNVLVVPKHFFGKPDKDFVKKFNYEITPVTGPYIVSKVDKGKSITMSRVKSWWGENERFFKNRFNVDNVVFKVVRDDEIAFENFKKGELDNFWLTRPVWWHEKAKGGNFDKGYIEKYWFYNDSPEGPQGFWLNLGNELFKDKNLRYAFAHALNIDLVIQKLLYGDYERKKQFFEGFGPYSATNVKAREFSIPKVKELMEKSGWKRGADGIWAKDGKRFSVKVTIGNSPQLVKRLEVMKEEAKKAGVEINIDAVDSAASFKSAREKKFEVYYGAMTTDVIPSPKNYFHSSFANKPQNDNFSNIDDPEMDKLLEVFQASSDEKVRQATMVKIIEKESEIGSFIGTFTVPYTREASWRWWKLPEFVGTAASEYLIQNPVHYKYGGLFWYDEAVHKETQEAMKAGKTYPPLTKIDKTYKPK
jgi:microcin C transport system substrate-binding protein